MVLQERWARRAQVASTCPSRSPQHVRLFTDMLLVISNQLLLLVLIYTYIYIFFFFFLGLLMLEAPGSGGLGSAWLGVTGLIRWWRGLVLSCQRFCLHAFGDVWGLRWSKRTTAFLKARASKLPKAVGMDLCIIKEISESFALVQGISILEPYKKPIKEPRKPPASQDPQSNPDEFKCLHRPQGQNMLTLFRRRYPEGPSTQF